MKHSLHLDWSTTTILRLVLLIGGLIIAIVSPINFAAAAPIKPQAHPPASLPSDQSASPSSIRLRPNVQAKLGTRSLEQEVVIRVSERGVSTPSLVVTAGSTVVWRNLSSKPIRIEFVDNGPAATCNEPAGFELRASGLSVSEKLHPGDVASVCFVDLQQYRYRVIEVSDGKLIGEGLVSVTKTY